MGKLVEYEMFEYPFFVSIEGGFLFATCVQCEKADIAAVRMINLRVCLSLGIKVDISSFEKFLSSAHSQNGKQCNNVSTVFQPT